MTIVFQGILQSEDTLLRGKKNRPEFIRAVL